MAKLAFLFTGLLFPLFAPGETITNAPVHYIQLEGSVNPGSAAYLAEALRTAEHEKAQAVILRLDTPGGLLSSTRDMIRAVSGSNVPLVVYVGPGGARATSAGALLTLSAHVAAMAPGTNLGAAHPVGGQGEEIKGPMGEKATNDTAALARAQATLRGRDPQVAEKIVTKSESYSAEEAVRAKAVDLVAADLDSLLAAIDGRTVKVGEPPRSVTLRTKGITAAQLVAREMSLQQKALHFLADPNVSTLLLTIGGIAIYAEVSSGFALIVPGVVGLFCFLLGFVSLQVIPTNVGGALLFALGFALLGAEIFVTSYGLLTVAALACLFLGGLFLVDPSLTDMRVSLSLLIPLVASVGVVMAGLGYILVRDRRAVKNSGKNSGLDPLLGTTARVTGVAADGRSGTAFANGEIWNFDSAEPVREGELRLVKARNSLRLVLGNLTTPKE